MTNILKFTNCITTGAFIFISLDSCAPLLVKLSTIPKSINDVDPDKKYRLIGIGRYRSGHYTALCFTTSKVWLEMDDLATTVPPTVITDSDILIDPHLCVYQKCD